MAPAIADPDTVRAVLNPESLLAAASAECGLDDYGDRYFVEPLTGWCEALATEARLSPMGVEMLRLDIGRMLVNRLRMRRDIVEHPEILEEDVSAPIIVVGCARTGTTKAQRMLSAHGGTQTLPFWRLLNPAPFPDAGPEEPRIAVAEQNLELMAQMFPDWLAGHPAGAFEADEEIFMMEATFEVVTYWRTQVPSFEAWCLSRPAEPVYRHLADQLRYLQWQNPGEQGKPFVMKAVVHIRNLDVLVDQFPGATLLHCHRDPRVVIPSAARLLELLRVMTSEDVDLFAAGRDELRFWREATAINVKQRDELGDRLRIVDAHYDDIVADPLRVLRQVTDAHGLPTTTGDERAMQRWQDEHPQFATGRHVYSLERYGLTADLIDDAFGHYLDRFPFVRGAA